MRSDRVFDGAGQLTAIGRLRRSWVGVVAAALVVGGCSCPPRLERTNEDPLRVAPAELDWGAVFVGATKGTSVSVTNPSRGSRTVTMNVAAPFLVSPTSLTLGGGEAAAVEVSFAPREAGNAEGRVAFEDSLGMHLDVPVTGVGLEPLVCGAAACESAVFDAARGACVLERQPDGTSCTASEACFSSAECVAGVCLGRLASCEDHDPCTVDACGAGGCVHAPVQCPALDACQVAYCAADAGCTSRPVDDGVLCVASDCATAFICLGGTCQQRARPNAARDCAYDDLSSSSRDVCVRTLAGDIRCWGTTGPRAINGPHRVPAPPGLRFIPNGPGSTIAGVDLNGQPYLYEPQQGAFVPLLKDGGVYPAPVVMMVQDELVLLADGSLASASDPNPFRPDAGVRALVYAGGAYLMLFSDGGVQPLGPTIDYPSIGEAVTALEDARFLSVCARTAVSVRCFTRGAMAWSETHGGDAGVLVGSGQCLGTAGGDVACGASRYQFAGGLTHLTAFHESVLCGLSPANQVSCVGSNVATWPNGGLGDLSMLPVGPVDAPLANPAAAIAVAEGASFAATDAGVWAWGHPWYGFDAGAQPRLVVAASGLTQLAVAPPRSGLDLRVAYLDEAHRVRVFPGGSVFEPVSTVSSCSYSNGEDFCGLRADGGWYWTNWWQGPVAVASFVSSAGSMYLDRDGGVVMGASPTDVGAATPVALPAPAIAVSEGCAVLADHRTFCGGFAIGGLLPARAVVGDLGSGCVIVGTNGVQCWGSNQYGRLGNELASSPTAVFLPMPEPVLQLAGSRTHTCALLRSGKARCWGLNVDGQLGVEPRTTVSTPVLVSQ